MTNTKNTKRALLGSVLALLLCVSMLVGTTFAWFTDSVTSAGNKIQAGTLDVDLFMWNGTAETDRVEITNESDPIFDIAAKAQNSAKTLWEPGKTQVVYLSIKNNGTLDLKYKVALNVKDADAEQNLYEVMKYAIKNDAKHGTVDTWDGTNANSVVPGINTTQANDVALGAGQEHFFALSVHMEESAGNKYQGGQVDFDIKVLAAQLNSENDSFDNSYDILAEYEEPQAVPSVNVYSAADLQAALSPEISNNNAVVNIEADIQLADGETWTSLNLEPYSNTVKNIVINGNGHTISGLNAPLIGDVHFGNTSVEINDLTLADVEVADFANTNGLGSAAFIAWADNSKSIVFNNCHLQDSTITATGDFIGIGGLIGYSSSTLAINNCSVTGTTITGAQNSAGAIAGHVSAGHNTEITNAKVVDCVIKGERVDKTGYVVGTANNGATTITTSADCARNTVFDVANSTTIYGRLVGGTLTVNGVAQ